MGEIDRKDEQADSSLVSEF